MTKEKWIEEIKYKMTIHLTNIIKGNIEPTSVETFLKMTFYLDHYHHWREFLN